MFTDPEVAYRAVSTRDTRFDGQFVTAVRTTGIYCRPGCPARTPLRRNVDFYPTSAAAQAAGFRACRRCLPDAAPGSPEWNLRADTVGAAMRLIADGVADREGIPGLADRLGYSTRQVNRLLLAEVGAGPLALARANRARSARILLTSTDLPIAEVAFAAGFSSVRQFNETIRGVYETDPSTLRAQRTRLPGTGALTLRLAVRPPFDSDRLLAFLAARTVTGVEVISGRRYSRALRLPSGPAVVELEAPAPGGRPVVSATLHLTHLSDLVPAVDRCRRLMDADADPVAVDELLGQDPVLAESVRLHPGLRVPGAVDGWEVLLRALLGQQVSLAAARTALSRLTAEHGDPLPAPLADLVPGVSRLFPGAPRIGGLELNALPGPGRRAATVLSAARAVTDGGLRIDSGRRGADLTAELTAIPGIGAWTAGYVVMRVLGDPDVLLTGDLMMRRGAAHLGLPDTPAGLAAAGQRWRPFRSYAGQHLWLASRPTADLTSGARPS